MWKSDITKIFFCSYPIKSEIGSLTLPEKRCILFLTFSVLSKQACLIKGKTASGKSHIIRLFAKMLGKKLHVYQMNSETSVSILTGQSVLSNKLSSEDIDDIEKALIDLGKIEEIRQYINDNIKKVQPDKWTRKLFSDLIEFISSDHFNTDQKNEIESAKQIIVDTIQPAKRFHIEKASFINAMTNGDWVLFDGIENAPSEIIEKISSLCGVNPQLDLLECGEGYYFTMNGQDGSNPINKKFHLFFTYNPTSQIENKTLDPDFLNNCASFTLPSIDSTPESSAQRLLGTMIQSYPKKITVEISKRLAVMHSFAKRESEKDNDSFAGDLQFTGRTINFVSKEFAHHAEVCPNSVETIYNPICYSMKYYYLNSYVNKEKENDFKTNMMNEFSKKLDPKEFMNLTYEGINLKDKYKEILIDLRNIQISEREERKSYSFKFADFVQKCFELIQINNIDFILDHIYDTLQIIDKSDKDFTQEFCQLKIIANILEEIKKGKKNLNDESSSMNLNDEDLLKTDELNQPLSRFRLLCKLVLNDSKCFSSNIPRILYNSDFVSLMNLVNIIQKEYSLDNFKAFIQHLNSHQRFIPLIEHIFPYNLFNGTASDMIHYILPMIRKLHESKITFNFFVVADEYKFIYDKVALFEPTFIVEDKEELTLSHYSEIAIKVNINNDIKIKIPEEKFHNIESLNSYYFNVTKYFVDDDKNIGKFLSLKDSSSFIHNSNPRKNQVTQLSLILSTKEIKSLISSIWPIVYSFPPKTVKIFSEYLLHLEKDTLLSFSDIYEIISKDNVEKIYNFSTWMLDFGKENSYLWKINNNKSYIDKNTNYKDANEIKTQLEKEIKYLEDAPQFSPKKIWSAKPYIKLLKKHLDNVNDLIDQIIQKDEHLKLMKKLKPILDKLEEISSKKNESLRDQIYNDIRKDSKQNLSEEKIIFYQDQVNKFIESIKPNDYECAKNKICWPTYKMTKEISGYKSPTMELYQIIIWYSTIISIFDKINDTDIHNIYPYIIELSSFEEMQDVVAFITNHSLNIANSDAKGLSADENAIINGILNAHFIYKLITKNLIDKTDNLYLILNHLDERNAITDENILYWIHTKAYQYPPDFAIKLPHFQPKDLIYLFIGYNESNTDNRSGPLLDKVYSYRNDTFIQNLRQLLATHIPNSVQCSIAIAQNIYKIYSNETNQPPNDYKDLMKFLTNYNSHHQYNKNTSSALKVMEIAKQIDKIKPGKFTFNDTFFFEENWISKEKYANRYPSLVFWLCKNHLCADKLKNIFGDQQFSENELPFWLFVLRLMSSESCIAFDSSSTTQTAIALCQILNKEVRKQISKKRSYKEPIGTRWLNILLPSPEIPSCKYQSFYQMFYQFFINLSDDKKLLQSETFNIKRHEIKRFIKQVCDFVLNDDNPDSIFDLPIDSQDEIISLIRNPDKFIGNEIVEQMKKISYDFRHSDEMCDLISFIKNLKDDVNKHIAILKSIIDKKNKEKQKQLDKEREKRRKKELKEMKKNMFKSAYTYKKQFDKISSDTEFSNIKEFQDNCNSLISSKNILPNCFITDVEPLQLIQFIEKTRIKNSYYMKKVRFNKNDYINIYTNKPYYFYPWQSDEAKKILSADPSKWSLITLFPFDTNFDLKDYCNKNYKETTVFQLPSLLFGQTYSYSYSYGNNYYSQYQLISKITSVSNDAINFVTNLQKELKDNHINDNTFRTPDELIQSIQSLTFYFYAHYSDDSDCTAINSFLLKMKDIFTQLSTFIKGINSKLKKSVETMWKASYQRFILKPVFDDGYELPIPKVSFISTTSNLFKNIQNTNFISNPILSVDENGSIVCCFNSINSTLGPFIPSLYSQQFALNFISFIDEPFTMTLEPDQKYSDLFKKSLSRSFSKGESVQIFFSLPNVESNKPEDHKISTKIIFESEKYQKLTLPCNLSIKVVPLSYLISCKQSQLSFKDNAFYVCKDKLISSSLLTFSINNFYLNEPANVLFQLISLDNNTITKPKIVRKVNELELQIPVVTNVKRLHAELILKFSDMFSTSILIDAIVIPFDFEFEVYDPTEKRFNKEATVYYNQDYLRREIRLHFRILCLPLNEELKGEIKPSFPYEIKIKKYDNIKDRFLINGTKEFDIILTIKSVLKPNNYNYYYSDSPSYNISININGLHKDISLKFTQFTEEIMNYYYNKINTKLLAKFNGYAYKTSGKEWNHIHELDDTIEYCCFVTPFSYFKQSKSTVSYINGCAINNSSDNFFVFVNEDGGYITNASNNARIEGKGGFFSKMVNGIKKLFARESDYYPIFGVSGNNWYPAFGTYPKINWLELDLNVNNIETAKKDIENVSKPYKSAKFIDSTHFYHFMKLLTKGKVIKQLKNFIQYLPTDIKVNFDDVIAYAETLNIDDQQMIILSHNAILLFFKHFQDRYKEIKDNRNYISPESLDQNEIDQKIKECYEEYCKIDPKSSIYSKNYYKFKEMEIAISDFQLAPKPSEQHESFLYTEKSLPIPVPYDCKPKYVSVNNSKISDSAISQIKFVLPDLSIPDHKKVNKLTIPELNNIYLSAIKGARLLPIFVSNMKSQRSVKMEKEAEEYFYSLLRLYNSLPVKDLSFISETTNLFIESFSSMIGKFRKAGVTFSSTLTQKHIISDENIQDFFQYPEKDEFRIPADQWNTKDKPHYKEPNNIEPPKPPQFEIDSDKPKNKRNSRSEHSSDSDKPTNHSVINEEEESMEDKNKKFRNLILSLREEVAGDNNNDENRNNNNDEITLVDDKKDDKTDGPSQNVFVVSNDNIKEITPDDFEKLDLTEKNGIERVYSLMKNMKNDSVLNLAKPEPKYLDPNYLNTDKDEFPINKLIPFGFYFANKFIIEASDMNIPRSKFAVNILVDCSSFISDENKIFNMVLICALTTALESLEIPYSAAVIADLNFKFVIKPFEEPHSPKCLQRILDCLLIKHRRTKLANSIKYAIDTMAYPNDDNDNENKRPYRAIFTFSNGIDEQLILTNAWAKSILVGDNLSFGFIFVKPSILVGEKLKFFEDVWHKLEAETNKNKAFPIVSIASIKLEMSEEISDTLSQLFRTVMKRNIVIDTNEVKQVKYTYTDATFAIDERLSNINGFSSFIASEYKALKEVYTNSTQVLKKANSKFDKLNPLKYRNKLRKIANCELDQELQKEVYHDFIKRFILRKDMINQASLEAIFKPNKASQTVLSTTGTDFDITALVLNLINPVPDPLIYLEEKGGLIRNYGISIVVDSSISCFDKLSGPHSFRTLQTILSSLATLDISCFDLIVTGNPQPTVLCSEVGTIHSLSAKSMLYNSLFAILQNPIHGSNLSSAIHTAFDLRRMRSSDHTSILFVLTNGLYDNVECERILNCVNISVQSGMTTFGVGIGNYPKGIEKLFPHVIFSPNPENVMKGIASFYGDSLSSTADEMLPINFIRPKMTDFISISEELIENEKTPIFNSLKDFLDNMPITLDAFSDMYNEERPIGDAINGFTNPVGTDTEIYKKDLLKTQKILIVMLWDYTLNEDVEEHFVHPKYINEPSEKGAGCIKTAVEYFGITLEIVQNYESAINELTKQTKENCCDYYAVWVFCGPPFELLPEKDADPHLVGQFNEVLIKFWKNGGSIVFWAEGDPLHYQVNLFLETADFEDECPSGKVSFSIGGNHKGTNILYGEESDTLKHPKTFNRMKRMGRRLERTKLSHNIGKIYEGITISYAPYDLKDIKPFKPFSRDSEGGISSLFYEANPEKGTGDIVIDCGYTKCFTKMSTDGTFRYVQNIAGWTARPEHHAYYDNKEPSEWRPKAVTHKIVKGVVWPNFELLSYDPKKLRTLWAIDVSQSTRDTPFYYDVLKKVVDEYYKDNDEIYIWYSTIEKISKSQLQTFINNKSFKNTGTKSSYIAQIANQSEIRDHLLIVTDGGTELEEVKKSDQMMKDFNIKFKFVSTFIIHDKYMPFVRDYLNDSNGRAQIAQTDLSQFTIVADLSVGAAFSRNTQNITYSIEGLNEPRVELATLKSEDINALKNINSINDYKTFAQEYEKLDHAIQASALGKPKNDELVSQLNALKGRVTNSGLDSQQHSDFDKKFQVLYRMADGKLEGTFKLEDIAAAKQGTV